MLNRDTWSHDVIQGLLKGNFIFWQRGASTVDGLGFISMYKVDTQLLPLIMIVDPRTGACVNTITGFVSPDQLAASLLEFQEENTVDMTNEPKVLCGTGMTL